MLREYSPAASDSLYPGSTQRKFFDPRGRWPQGGAARWGLPKVDGLEEKDGFPILRKICATTHLDGSLRGSEILKAWHHFHDLAHR